MAAYEQELFAYSFSFVVQNFLLNKEKCLFSVCLAISFFFVSSKFVVFMQLRKTSAISFFLIQQRNFVRSSWEMCRHQSSELIAAKWLMDSAWRAVQTKQDFRIKDEAVKIISCYWSNIRTPSLIFTRD